ncbi:hypothetical protein BRE01_24090 [Brevibacillus reuszeri]|uniref:Uncharacterized protein n=1 Tax=Brevibacillus reuszeri TaxID=54915 RepID=A0A0K9YP31_9BACL|nr:hypothetical protein [Brevibacillus reuszeri]KNB69935.1 hypothetical protein ADS79_29325 [Brevibacillus reuszeri]MED1858297.1 hypothetical protein [Brevibacillus reuszeri]GED68707.1 hypothetical protein BRE01_24090 [Brevibacillus reuszeri]
MIQAMIVVRSSLSSGHYENTVTWAHSMGVELQAGGLEHLMDASFATEKSLAVLTRSKTLQNQVLLTF